MFSTISPCLSFTSNKLKEKIYVISFEIFMKNWSLSKQEMFTRSNCFLWTVFPGSASNLLKKPSDILMITLVFQNRS